MDEHLQRIPDNQFERIAEIVVKQINRYGFWADWLTYDLAARYCSSSEYHIADLVEAGMLVSKSIWIPKRLKPRRLIERKSLEEYIRSSPNTKIERLKKDSLIPESPDPTDQGSPLVSAAVVAKRFGCSAAHVLKLAREGEIPSHRIGPGCVRFDLDAVLDKLGVSKKAWPRCY